MTQGVSRKTVDMGQERKAQKRMARGLLQLAGILRKEQVTKFRRLLSLSHQ